MGLEKKRSGYIKKVLMFSFNPCVLLWGFNTRLLVKNAMFKEKLMEIKFKRIIGSERFYFGLKLGENKGIKMRQ